MPPAKRGKSGAAPPKRRMEASRLLLGQGRYTGDIVVEGMSRGRPQAERGSCGFTAW